MANKPDSVELDCDQVGAKLSDYLDEKLTPDLKVRIAEHLAVCRHCTALYDGIRNVVQLLADARALELPAGFSQRLYRRFFSGSR